MAARRSGAPQNPRVCSLTFIQQAQLLTQLDFIRYPSHFRRQEHLHAFSPRVFIRPGLWRLPDLEEHLHDLQSRNLTDLTERILYMARAEPWPSSPSRPPKATIYFTADKEHFFAAIPFGHYYSARHYVQSILDTNPNHSWLDDNTIEVRGDNHTLQIKSPHLEEIVEYQPKPDELDWRPAYPDSQTLQRLVSFDAPVRAEPILKQPSPEKKPARRAKSRKTQDGFITVAELADEYNISSGKARNLLRKANFKKPSQGWQFTPDDPLLKQVRAILNP